MNWLEQFLLWITYLNVYPGSQKMNILGVFWLISLMFIAVKRFSWQFTNIQDWKKPEEKSRGYLWTFAILLFTFIAVFMWQIIIDDLITVPINLAFGSWPVMVPGRGAFSIEKLFIFKWDNYAYLAISGSLFYLAGIWKMYHFTKASLIWLSITIVDVVLLASMHVFIFITLSGYDRLFAFWVSYPWFRIFTGFLLASMIKKPGGS